MLHAKLMVVPSIAWYFSAWLVFVVNAGQSRKCYDRLGINFGPSVYALPLDPCVSRCVHLDQSQT